MILSFIDAGVLIAAARSGGDLKKRAEDIIWDNNRLFASSIFVRLEITPKPFHFKRTVEINFYEAFFQRVSVWVNVNDVLLTTAYQQAQILGLSALDALHIAAALQCGAAEFVTTEGPTKPLHRVQGIKVNTIHK